MLHSKRLTAPLPGAQCTGCSLPVRSCTGRRSLVDQCCAAAACMARALPCMKATGPLPAPAAVWVLLPSPPAGSRTTSSVRTQGRQHLLVPLCISSMVTLSLCTTFSPLRSCLEARLPPPPDSMSNRSDMPPPPPPPSLPMPSLIASSPYCSHPRPGVSRSVPHKVGSRQRRGCAGLPQAACTSSAAQPLRVHSPAQSGPPVHPAPGLAKTGSRSTLHAICYAHVHLVPSAQQLAGAPLHPTQLGLLVACCECASHRAGHLIVNFALLRVLEAVVCLVDLLELIWVTTWR